MPVPSAIVSASEYHLPCATQKILDSKSSDPNPALVGKLVQRVAVLHLLVVAVQDLSFSSLPYHCGTP